MVNSRAASPLARSSGGSVMRDEIDATAAAAAAAASTI